MKPIYISATVQDSGKTSVSLGLMQVLKKHNPGYCKPVGQHYLNYMDTNVDEDAVLVHQVFNVPEHPYFLSPIAVERGFTRKFIFNPDVEPMEKEIIRCQNQLAKNHPFVIFEGTGHAGVGSCIFLSNARVAELLGAKVVIVTGGGIGKPIDEIAVSLSLFKQHNVEVLGVILNKVLPEKYDKIRETVARGLENIGTRLIGAIPYEPTLTYFNMGQLAEELNYRVLCGEEFMSNRIENTVVAAMEPQNVIRHLTENMLIIVPGDRLDNILLTILYLSKNHPNSGGLVLTCGVELPEQAIPLLKTTGIPILTTEDDTFKVSSRLAKLGFKIRTYDTEKIKKLHSLTEKYVDTDAILKAIVE